VAKNITAANAQPNQTEPLPPRTSRCDWTNLAAGRRQLANGVVRVGRLPHRTIALVTLVAATVLLPPLDKPAGAHYGSPRLSICATSGKYGCASYQFTLVYTIYGNYYDNTHIHTCTDKGGDSVVAQFGVDRSR